MASTTSSDDHQDQQKGVVGILGIHRRRISCVIGVYPEERQQEQILIVDAKIKVHITHCLASDELIDTVDYLLIAELCTRLAQEKKYFLLERLASDILEACLSRFQALWGWVRIEKPLAIADAACAFVELERFATRKKQ